ncbi:MAG: pilus assembly protein N-terminal domain-containing protein [Pseudomonadota bacterium]
MDRPNKTIRAAARRSCILAAAVLGGVSLSAPASAAEPIYRVDLNKTQILRLPAAAGSVVVGNPSIADITVHSPTMIMVVGRGFGETNLIVLDRAGETMVDADIQVTAITPSNGVRLFKATSRETYSCAPYCQPSPVLGDSPEHLAANAAPSQGISAPSSVFESDPGLSGDPFESDDFDFPN